MEQNSPFIIHLVRYGRKELYSLKCGYNEKLVSLIKALPKETRSYNAIDKNWDLNVKGLYELMTQVKGTNEFFFKFQDDDQRTQFANLLSKIRNRAVKQKEKVEYIENLDKDILQYKEDLKEIAKTFDYKPFLKEGIVPMQHQIIGALFAKKLADSNTNCLLAMGLGSGKSLTSILTIEMMPDVKKCLFIVPANLRLNIQNEVHKFTNSYCYVPRLKKKDGKYTFVKYKRNNGRSFDECKYFVLSYDYFSDNNFDPELKIQELGFDKTDIIIYDEFQYLSSKKSLRFENIKQSFEGMVKREIGLSATPLVGNISKFFPLLKKLKPLVFSNESKFRTEFCGQRYFKKPMDYNMQWHTVETPRLEELNAMLQPIMYRVRTQDVLEDLPPLTIHQVIVEMTDAERKEYGDIYCGLAKIDWESNALISDEDTATTSALNILMRLRQFTAKVKLKKAKDMIEELNDDNEKVVFFDTFKEPLRELERTLGDNSRLYTGDQSGDRKQFLVDEFQSDNTPYLNLLVSLMAGNAGITLTKSRNIIQNSLSLIPHENTQAYGRIHRNGQTEKCNVYILTLADTVDEMIYENYMSLQSMINAVIDNENMEEVMESMELDIIKKLKDEATKK